MSELLIVHIVLGASALLPSALMHVLNFNKKNGFIGYNTPRGLKTEETREFSAKFAAKGMFWAGLATICIQATLYFLVEQEAAILITALVMTVAFITVIIITEQQLSARFDEDGKPKAMHPKF